MLILVLIGKPIEPPRRQGRQVQCKVSLEWIPIANCFALKIQAKQRFAESFFSGADEASGRVEPLGSEIIRMNGQIDAATFGVVLLELFNEGRECLLAVALPLIALVDE